MSVRVERGLEWVRGGLDERWDLGVNPQSMLCLLHLVTYMAVHVCVTGRGGSPCIYMPYASCLLSTCSYVCAAWAQVDTCVHSESVGLDAMARL